MGFSLGGLVALRLALDHPGLVRSLVLISTIGLRGHAERSVVEDRIRQAENDFDAGVEEMIRRWFRPSWLSRDAALADALARSIGGSRRESYLACYRLFGGADAELWPRLFDVTVPTTVITGAEDTGATPAMAAQLANAIPGADHQVIPDAAHPLPLERPGAVARTVLSHVTDAHEVADTPGRGSG